MIVQCDACNSKFRLDDSKVRDQGVKVRCTKCQNVFMVAPSPLSEEMTQKKEVPPEILSVAQTKPSLNTVGMTISNTNVQNVQQTLDENKDTVPQWGTDFSFEEKPNEEKEVLKKTEWDIGISSSKEELPISFDDKKEPSQPESVMPKMEFDISKDENLDKEDKQAITSPDLLDFAFHEELAQKTVKTSFDADSPSKEKDFFVTSNNSEKQLQMDIAPSSDLDFETNEALSEPPSEQTKTSPLKIIIALIILFLAVGIGIFYFKTQNSLLFKTTEQQKSMDIIGLHGYYLNNISMGQLFIIEGSLTSNIDTYKNINGIRGMLFDSNGKMIKDAWVAPGRIASRDELKIISASDLEKRFRDRNGRIPPKGTVPFMIVFQNVSGTLSEISVETGE